MDTKEERFIVELNSRTALWEQKKANAQGRIELGVEVPLAEKDLAVAEDALERIAKKIGKLLGVVYPEPAKVAKEDGRPEIEEPKALFELSPVPAIVERHRSKGDKKDE